MKVLIVDDDKNILKFYEAELREDGHHVLVCSTAECAMETFQKENPDIVTLDILMPGIDGRRILRTMKEQSPHTPVIISSAYDYCDDTDLWASDAYIMKSLDTTELRSTINRLMHNRPTDH